jgi:hypothetical protein
MYGHAAVSPRVLVLSNFGRMGKKEAVLFGKKEPKNFCLLKDQLG